MNETQMGRFEERRQCAKPGCKRRSFTRFCSDHFPRGPVRKIDRENVVPRNNPVMKKETGVNAPEGEQQ